MDKSNFPSSVIVTGKRATCCAHEVDSVAFTVSAIIFKQALTVEVDVELPATVQMPIAMVFGWFSRWPPKLDRVLRPLFIDCQVNERIR